MKRLDFKSSFKHWFARSLIGSFVSIGLSLPLNKYFLQNGSSSGFHPFGTFVIFALILTWPKFNPIFPMYNIRYGSYNLLGLVLGLLTGFLSGIILLIPFISFLKGIV